MAGVTVVTVAVVIAATTVVTVEVAATPMLHNGLRLSIGVGRNPNAPQWPPSQYWGQPCGRWCAYNFFVLQYQGINKITKINFSIGKSATSPQVGNPGTSAPQLHATGFTLPLRLPAMA
jgi:hypothetical protein